MFAIGVPSRQVLSHRCTRLPGSSRTPCLHRCQTFNSHPKRDWTLEKHSIDVFPAGQSLPHVLFPYSMLWRLYNIKQGLYDLFCWGQNLKKTKNKTPPNLLSEEVTEPVMLARRWKKVSEAEKGTWVFGDDNSISFSYTAIQMIGKSLQKLYLGSPIQIQPPKESYLENPTQIQFRFSFKCRKSTALRREECLTVFCLADWMTKEATWEKSTPWKLN